MRFVNISYVETVIKTIEWISQFCHVRCLQMETSLKKFHRVKKYVIRFVGKMMFKLEFGLRAFSIGNKHHSGFMLIFEIHLKF
jgi:hypothetical protein